MANKSIFIAENMASTKVGSLLRSAKQATAIENGALVALGSLVSGELDLYTAEAVAAITNTVYLVDGVEVIYDESTVKGLHDFENVADKPFRVRKPVVGDRFSISASMITALATAVVEGNVVETPATGNKLAEKATATATASLVCKIVKKWTLGSRAIPMVRLEVIKVA